MAHASQCQVTAYLLGHGLLILGFIFFVVGFATDSWIHVEYKVYGLWQDGGPNAGGSSWIQVTRAMQVMALICYMSAFLLALLFICLEQTSCQHGHAGKERIPEMLGAAGTVLCLIGVSVYGSERDNDGRLEFSYGLSVTSLFLTAPGLIMVAVTRSDVRSKKTVGPLPDRASNTMSTLAVSSTQQLGLARGSGGSAGGTGQQQSTPRFSYGRGQTWTPGNAGGANVGMNGGARNGDTRDAREGQLVPPLPRLPYSIGLSPDRSVDSGPVSPAGFAHNHYPMLQPDPHPDMGGGGSGGDYWQNANHYPMPQPEGGYGNGQGRGQGRLPPLSEPSAPPNEGDAPPSYMEAISGGRR